MSDPAPLPKDHLVREATACAKHLDEEGMGYSADVMRRTVAEIERLRGELAAGVVNTGKAYCAQCGSFKLVPYHV